MVVNSQEIKEIVSSTLKSLSNGLEDTNCMIGGLIEFELSVIKEGDMEGGFNLVLASTSGKISEKKISKIKFNILSKDVKGLLPLMWKVKYQNQS